MICAHMYILYNICAPIIFNNQGRLGLGRHGSAGVQGLPENKKVS